MQLNASIHSSTGIRLQAGPTTNQGTERNFCYYAGNKEFSLPKK
jgi:hypothetical protein